MRVPALAEKTVPPPAPAEVRASTGRLRTGRVLVVDDNPDAAEMMATLLRHSGHTIEVAHDGSTALATAERFAPDVALLDIGIPGMDGYEIATRLRAMPGGKKLHLIALTGYTQDAHIAAAHKSGFDHHLSKPVDIEVLSKLIQRALHERRD